MGFLHYIHRYSVDERLDLGKGYAMFKLFKRREKRPIEQYVVLIEYAHNVNGIASSVHIFDTLNEARVYKQKVLFDNNKFSTDCKVKILLLEDYRKELNRVCLN